MKSKLIALTISSALALGTLTVLAQPGEGHGPGHRGMHGPMGGNPLEHMTKDLNLTAQQQAQVAPIIEAAKPQIKAIHEDAMQKMRAVMESTGAQIRPLLTPDQQTKFDAMKKAHEDMMKAHQEMEQAKQK